MSKIDLIIDALECAKQQTIKGVMYPAGYHMMLAQALAAARELRDMKPMAWWEKDPDTGNWFLATWFNEHAETEPLYALDEVNHVGMG